MVFGSKKNPVENIEKAIEKLEDLYSDINTRKKVIERKIKNFLKKGKMPPVAYLIRWRQTKNLLTVLDNSIATLHGTLMLNEFQEILKTVTRKSSVKEAMETLEQILSEFKETERVLASLIKTQETFTKEVSRLTDNISARREILESLTQDISQEVSEKIGKEILEEFVSTLPPDVKQELLPQIETIKKEEVAETKNKSKLAE